MAEVIFKNVIKRFGEVEAVSRFSLTIHDQEFMVVVGPSGCGKSTMLRMVAGLEEVTEGDIYIDDRLVNDVPPKDRDIAMVFQNYALYPHMNVHENMAFGLRLRRFAKSDIEQRVQEAARILGIENLLQRKPKQLSGGQRQRVAVGRAIVRRPKVFLFNEPLSNLDAKLRVQMRAEISKLHSQLQATVLYVTHDQVEAMTMGNRIVIMKDGILQQVGTPLDIYDNPTNLFVAGFIGSPAMNFLPGTLEFDHTQPQMVVNDHTLPIQRHLNHSLTGSKRNVTFGIRPEDMEDAAFESDLENCGMIDAEVQVIEPMGSETYIHASFANRPMVARVHAKTKAVVGKSIRLALHTENLHIFDAENENNLLLADVD